IGTVAKAINPKIRVIGAVAANSPAMTQSINSGRIVRVYVEKTIADGIAGNIEPDSMTFQLAQEVVDDWVVIEEPEIVGTVFEFLDNEGMLIEGSAAVAAAAVSRKHVEIKPKEKVGVVICGGNIARQEWREILVQHLVGAKRGA
ncbi:MAG: pyridoxal-phosphate dependent enzyme, partial [Terriglobales bacterium]